MPRRPPVSAAKTTAAQAASGRRGRGGNRFACTPYRKLQPEQGNLFFSPASISMALAMTYAGAAGITQEEMAKTLHFEMPLTDLNRQMAILRNSWTMKGPKPGMRLDVANRLWGQEGYRFEPAFLQINRDVYGADVGRLDFNTQAEQVAASDQYLGRGSHAAKDHQPDSSQDRPERPPRADKCRVLQVGVARSL